MRKPGVLHGWSRALIAVVALALPSLAQPRKPQPPKTVRLYVFDCGILDNADTSRYNLKRDEIGTHLMSVPAFLIVHPKGTLIWDTGAIPDGDFKPNGLPATLNYATSLKPLAAQLAEIGYRPSDITYLALSHFHWDHVGNANEFAGATWLVRPGEREIMFAQPPSPRTIPAHFSALKNSKTVVVKTDEYDVFGDGTVILKSAPGHSPDHQVLLVKLAHTGPVLLSGDLWHYPEERKLHRLPTMEYNREQTAASRERIEAYLKKTGAQLWIQHDYLGNLKLKKAPAFYE
ncbi:MAG TPA: N-acyl homoserine lactonase family protein [Bryobacteraceae bacterium]|nr:N-acyl homoserine lactonase family protein [Bryobacteraceae bacterium]